MMAAATVEMRPRTTGEILDDAWRLALADSPLLLLLSGLFLVPAFCVLLWLATRFSPDGLLWPAVGASLLILTGLGSGACQELLRRRASGEVVAVVDCLRAALGRGLGHVSARALVLAGTLPGPVWAVCALAHPAAEATPPFLVLLTFVGAGVLGLLGLGLWIFAAPVHVILAGDRERSTALGTELASAARFATGKATVVVGSRLPLLGLAVLNLHLLLAGSLWAADNLGGLETARLRVEMALGQNPPYLLALLLLCWLLLAPFFEAGNFLLHLDVRTRQEGLDLFYRVQRAFPLRDRLPLPASPRGKGAVVALLVGLALLGSAAPASASDEAGARPLHSKEEIKKLLGRHTGGRTPAPARPARKPRPRKKPSQEEHKEPARPTGARMRRPMGGGGRGLGSTGWIVLGGLALGLLAMAGYQLWTNRGPRKPRKTTTGTMPKGAETSLPQPHEESAPELWRRADEYARAGRYLDAVRSVYLAILSLLHRQALIRFEPMRTNGEYVQQLRRAEAPSELADGFRRLTAAFEIRWYGERRCGADEYAQCRQLAEEVQSQAGAAPVR